jgi:hypothetical protein
MNAAQYLLYVAFLTPCFERWPMVVSRGYRWPTPESRDLTRRAQAGTRHVEPRAWPRVRNPTVGNSVLNCNPGQTAW